MVNFNLQWLATGLSGISMPQTTQAGVFGWMHLNSQQAENSLNGQETDTLFLCPYKGILHKAVYHISRLATPESNTTWRWNILHNSVEIPSSVFSHGPGPTGAQQIVVKNIVDPVTGLTFFFDKGDFLNHSLKMSAPGGDPNPGGFQEWMCSVLIEFVARR